MGAAINGLVTDVVPNDASNADHDTRLDVAGIAVAPSTPVSQLAFPSLSDRAEDLTPPKRLDESGTDGTPRGAATASASSGSRPVFRTVYRRAPVAPVVVEPLPEEELIVERQRVITVIRITENTGHVTEFRRVADRSGSIVHFRDGIAIPEHSYRAATGR